MVRIALTVIGLGCFYYLSFSVNPIVAGVMLVSHVAFEVITHYEQRRAAEQFMKMLDGSVESSEEPPHNVGNC
jgi:hypothetical protein